MGDRADPAHVLEQFDRVQDIADLTNLNEASVVHNLRERYTSEMIYVRLSMSPACSGLRSARRSVCSRAVIALSPISHSDLLGTFPRRSQSLSFSSYLRTECS